MDDTVVSYLSAFLWSSVFVEERHTKVVFGIETFDMRELFIYISRGELKSSWLPEKYTYAVSS